MLKMLINEEEVVSNKDFTIKKEMLNTPSVILNNVYPKTWEEDKDYTSRFYHPNDYSKCKIVDETYIPPEEGTTITSNTGEIYITDADNTKEKEYEIQGKAEQHSYSGKNLFNINGNVNINGRDGTQTTFNSVSDGILTTNSNTAKNHAIGQKYTDLNGKTITFSADVVSVGTSSGDPPRVRIAIYDNGTMATRTEGVVGDRLTITYTCTSDNIVCGFTTANGTGGQFTNIQVEISNSETSYEPFTNNLPTPNPYYPEEIKTVSGIGNLLDRNNCEEDKIGVWSSGSSTTNTNSLFSQYIEVKTNKKYSFEYGASVFFYSEDKTYLGCLQSNGTTIAKTTGGAFTNITIPNINEIYYMRLSFRYGSSTPDYTSTNIMVNEGEILHQYVPYGHWLPVKVSNKNLFDESQLLEATDWVKNEDGYYTGTFASLNDKFGVNTTGFNIFNTFKEKTAYTISFNAYVSAGTAIVRFYYTDNTQLNISISATSTTKYKTTTDSNKTISRIIANYSTGGTNILYIKDIQLVEGTTATDYIEHQEQTTLIDLNKYDENNNIVGNYEICTTLTAPANNPDVLTIKDGRAVLTKRMGKYVADSNSPFYKTGTTDGLYHLSSISTPTIPYVGYRGISNCFINNPDTTITANASADSKMSDGQFSFRWSSTPSYRDRIYFKYLAIPNDVTAFKQLMVDNNFTLYYRQKREDITLRGTYDINLYEGVNHISIVDDDLIPVTTLHYNYVNEQTITDLLFCGVVKNSGNISLNPRYPHYSTLQILDFKNFLSEGELDAFVISNKTILEAIQMVIDSISSYGFVLGNINILNPNEIIGAYSTKDKSAYDVFSYIADITQSRWTTRVIDENTVAIDFYDPSLMEQGTTIEYTQEFFKNNLIDDMDYSYGTNDYRNKQIMTSNQVYSNISQNQSIVANGYQSQFQTEQSIGQIISITSDGKELTFATNNAKELGFTADFYYTPGNNYFESADLRPTGEVLNIEYMAIVEGRQIITNPNEIQRVSDSTNRKGIVTRYENRNDAITSNELQLIGQSYIKYKGTPEIVLKIKSRSNIWEVGQRVQFNAPIDELNTEYMVRSKEINHIATTDTIFYTYELTSSFNSETAINYFDNQRAKAKGNIGEGEYISRNVDVESTANIIFYDTQATEVTITGDNSLNSVLNAPFIN